MIDWTLIPAALVLDALLGDPRRLPHPTRGLGRLATWVEKPLRLILPPLIAGGLGWLLVVGTALGFALGLPSLLGVVASAFGASPDVKAGLIWLGKAYLVYVSIAPRDLAAHALRIARDLASPDNALARARASVSMIVGRDVDRLDEAGIARAAIESVAESTVDGVCAPLFWALILGPAGALAYRAANTLDSMWGHKSPGFLLFGRVAARADDLLTWLPARLAFFAALGSAFALGLVEPRYYSASQALRLGWRDRRKHESPNAAWLEAAFAGALGLRLGGPASYGGKALDKPYLGEDRRQPSPTDIRRAILLMLGSCAFFSILLCAIAYWAG